MFANSSTFANRVQDAKVSRAERAATFAIDRAVKAIERNHPRADEFVATAEKRLAEWEALIGHKGWPLAR